MKQLSLCALLLAVNALSARAGASAASPTAAAKAGDWKTVEALVDKGASPDSIGGVPSRSLLMSAAVQGNVPAMTYLLSKGADVNLTRNGYSALSLAAAVGPAASVSFLLEHGADAAPDSWSARRAVESAVTKGRIENLRLLLQAGARLESFPKENDALLDLAAGGGSDAAFKLVYDALVKQPLPKARLNRLLFEAAGSASTDTVRFLLAQGADKNWRDEYARPVSFAAAGSGSLAVLQLVYDDAVGAGTRGKYGYSFLAPGTGLSSPDVIRWGLAHGATAGEQDYGGGPLELAAAANNVESMKLIAAAGVPLDRFSAYNRNQTALSEAAAAGATAAVKYLLDQAGDSFRRRGQLDYAYDRAAARGDLETLKLLKRAGADGSASYAAARAAQSGSGDAMRFVLANGGDARDVPWGQSVLELAAAAGSAEAVAAVVEAGGDAGRGQDSALVGAAGAASDEVVRYLIARGVYRGSKTKDLTDALGAAAAAGNLAVFRDLLDALGGEAALEGLDPDQLLSRAAGSPDGLPLVRFLLERGANAKALLADGSTPLMSAAKSGSPAVLELLLKRGANPKAVARAGDNAGTDAVWQAAPRGSRFLLPLLAAGGGARAADKNGVTALDRAASAEDAKALLGAGADLKALTAEGETPVAFAAARGDAELVKLLIARGVDPSRGTKKGNYRAGWSPLHAAIDANAGLETVAALLQGGAAPDAVEDYHGVTPLMMALAGGRVDLAKALIAKGADVRAKNKDGASAVHDAASFVGIEPLELVADALGADFDANAATSSGEVPLNFARSLPVVRFLLERGARVPDTKLSLICRDQNMRPLSVLKLLIDRGADAGGGSSNAGCPLAAAARSGRDDLMQLLLDHGAAVESGEPLAEAAAGGWVTSIQLLLDHGAQIDGQPGRKSPLAQAAFNGNLPAVKFLLKKGADINAVGRSGNSPLASTAQYAHWDVARYLLDAGLKREVLAHDGVDVLVAAANKGNLDFARLLVRKGVPARRDESSRFDESPLSAAASRGDLEMIDFLLKAGAKNEDSGAYGCSALCRALEYAPGDSATQAAEALLKGGANLDSLNGREGYAITDLMDFSRNANPDRRETTRRAMNWLLDHGAKVDAVTAQGRTALFYAASAYAADNVDLLLARGARAGVVDVNGDNALAELASSYRTSPDEENAAVAIAKRLLSAGAYASTADKNGVLPAAKAAQNKHAALLNVLLDADSSSVDARDGQGKTLLHTFEISGSTAVLRAILAHKPDVNVRDNNYQTPLIELVGWSNTFSREGHAEALGLLLAAGPDLNAVNNDGCTALGLLSSRYAGNDAELADQLGLAKILVEAGADPNRGGAESGKRCSPLAHALQAKKWGLAKLLLEHGADPNGPSNWENQPVIANLAASSQIDALKFLLDRKVSPDLRDGSGRTPLMEAASRDQIDAVRLLVDRGADGTLRDKDGASALMLAPGGSSTAAYLRNRFPDTEKPAAAYVARAAAPAPAAPAAAPALSSAEIQSIVRNAVQGAFSERQSAASAAPAAPAKKALVSDVDKPAYGADPRPDDVAIVVGIENYSGDLPSAEFAERDADAVAAHLAALGVPARNLIRLTGSRAGRASVEKYVEQWLPRVVKADSRVYFYFSGHGAPDPKTGASYIVPWDGDPNFLETTAYPVSRLYKKLGALKAASVLVAMDSCFSGAKGRSVLPRGARPLVTKLADTGEMAANLTALTASDGTQITGTIPEQGHGLFTYYLLKGLNGAAASDGRVSLGALYGYLKPRVSDEAARQNRDQTPQALPTALGDRASLRLR